MDVEVVAVGHRVVHGGRLFSDPQLITDQIESMIEDRNIRPASLALYTRTRDELLAWASSFGAATHAVIAMILDRNIADIHRAVIQASNVLDNLVKKHNNANLETACLHVLSKKLDPTMAVISV